MHKSDMIIVDRRRTARGKSLPNRERLLDRIRDAIRSADPENIGTGGVKASGAPTGGAGGANNPVTVAREALAEPTFHYARQSGKHTIVLIGNKEWNRGDDFPLEGESDEEGGGGEGGFGEDEEDDFIVNISAEEFYKVFFDDCELPNIQESTMRVVPDEAPSHAGFQRSGNPAQLSVIRSYKNSMGRRNALTKPAREELAELEAEFELRSQGKHPQGEYLDEAENISIMATLAERIEELRRKIGATPFFEELDLRFVHRERQQVKKAEAAFFMLMDVSGSMDEERKRIARKMFTLQYVFIKRTYPDTDIVFISHTNTPLEVTETDFFTSTRSGGTSISPAYTMAHDLINKRYDPNLTNIYLSHASDSDNWDTDNLLVEKELVGSGLLPKLRHMVYFHCGFGSNQYGARAFMVLLKGIANKSNNKLTVASIEDEGAVFTVFKAVYRKKG
jgi:hypothetical protein